MAKIFIDNAPYEVRDGQSLLQACLSLGFHIPHFCWHPALNSVGACRQCAVKVFRDAEDTQGKLVMSCMTAAADGTRLSIEDPEAKRFRAAVIELLMANHPHDCPVCDEGGECHLQDMTVMTGHVYRRYRFRKRTYRNQHLGPFLNHEMNRCIHCYRCIRFYREYAGGRDLSAFASANRVYFGRHADGPLESPFSGNLAEVCPTGVFTDKTLKRHFVRKWDLQTAPSVCVHCSLGCNTIPGERDGLLRSIRNRYHGQVNGYFLCDRGRYGYEFVNSDRRVHRPLLRDQGRHGLSVAAAEAALGRLSALLYFGAPVIGIGSPRASLEANFALRDLVGPDRFYSGMAAAEFRLVNSIIGILRRGPARTPSLRDVESSDAVLVLGEDVTNTSPRLALSLRQSVRKKSEQTAQGLKIPPWHDEAVRTATHGQLSPLFMASPAPTSLDDIAALKYRAAPDEIARLGFAVARELSPQSPLVADLPEDVRSMAASIADALQHAARPLVVSGTACGSEAVIHAAANIAWALNEVGRDAALCFALPECNSLGLALMGGRSIEEAFDEARRGAVETAIVLENDLYRRAASGAVDAFFGHVGHSVVIDHLLSSSALKAEVVLPAATFAESDGSLVSNEGRAQRFFRVIPPQSEVRESWRWIRDAIAQAGRPEGSEWRTFDDIVSSMAQALPLLTPVAKAAPPATFRMAGMKVPRQTQRRSGRTAETAHISVREKAVPDDPDSPLSFSMEGYHGQPPSSLIPRFWAPGWNSVQAVNAFQEEVGGTLRGGDPGVRLIENSAQGSVHYFEDVPASPAHSDDSFLLVPLYHVFGSEELSGWCPGISERAPLPYLALNAEDARRLAIKEGEPLEFSHEGGALCLPLRIIPGLPLGVCGFPLGLRDLPWLRLPARGRIQKGEVRR